MPCIFAIGCVRSSIPLFISPEDQALAADISGTAVFHAFSSGTQDRRTLGPNDKWDLFVSGMYTFHCCLFMPLPTNNCQGHYVSRLSIHVSM